MFTLQTLSTMLTGNYDSTVVVFFPLARKMIVSSGKPAAKCWSQLVGRNLARLLGRLEI